MVRIEGFVASLYCEMFVYESCIDCIILIVILKENPDERNKIFNSVIQNLILNIRMN